MTKKIFALVLALIMALSVFSMNAFAYKSISNVHDAMNFVRNCNGTYEIVRGTLWTDGKRVGRVYVVALTGTNNSMDINDLNCFWNCILAAADLPSNYFEAVKADMLKKIPEGGKVVFECHSLGGMIAQQLAADKEIKEKFEILNILGMGSPYVVQLQKREGDLHRLADSGDAIPWLSLAGLAAPFIKYFSYENCGYFGDPNGAHNYSYNTAEQWLSYDAFGIENGTNVIYY